MEPGYHLWKKERKEKKYFVFSGIASGLQILICSARVEAGGLFKHRVCNLSFPSAGKPVILLECGSEAALANIQKEAHPAKRLLQPPEKPSARLKVGVSL